MPPGDPLSSTPVKSQHVFTPTSLDDATFSSSGARTSETVRRMPSCTSGASSAAPPSVKSAPATCRRLPLNARQPAAAAATHARAHAIPAPKQPEPPSQTLPLSFSSSSAHKLLQSMGCCASTRVHACIMYVAASTHKSGHSHDSCSAATAMQQQQRHTRQTVLRSPTNSAGSARSEARAGRHALLPAPHRCAWSTCYPRCRPAVVRSTCGGPL